MRTIQFDTQIENGVVMIPDEWHKSLEEGAHAHVVILLGTPAADHSDNLVDRLLRQPLDIPNFEPLVRDAVHAR